MFVLKARKRSEQAWCVVTTAETLHKIEVIRNRWQDCSMFEDSELRIFEEGYWDNLRDTTPVRGHA